MPGGGEKPQLARDLRLARELEVGKADLRSLPGANDAVVDAQIVRRVEPFAAERRDVVVLLHPVAADAQSAHQAAIPIQRHAAGEPHDAALVQLAPIAAAARSRTFRTWALRVVDVQVEPRSGPRGVVQLLLEIDAGWKQRLAAEIERARGNRPRPAGGR